MALPVTRLLQHHGDGARGGCQIQAFAYIEAISGGFLQPACEKSPRTVADPHGSPFGIMEPPGGYGDNLHNWADHAMKGNHTHNILDVSLHRQPISELN